MTSRIVISTFLLLIASQILYAQKEGKDLIDSLLSELPKFKEDTNKLKVVCALAYEYSNSDPAAGIRFGEQGIKLSDKLNFRPGKRL